MAKQVNFEVQVKQGGRWTIHARYPGNGQEPAVEDAKQLSTSKIGEVRVLRDVYDASTGTSSERTVYKSKGLSQSSIDSVGGGDRGTSDYDNDGDDYDDDDFSSGFSDSDDFDDEDSFSDVYDEEAIQEKKRRKKEKKRREKEGRHRNRTQTSITVVVIKLLLVILMAMGVAATSVALASTFLDGANIFGIRMQGVSKENAMIYLFLFMFLATAFMLASVMLGNTNLKQKHAKPVSTWPKQVKVTPPKPQPEPKAASDDKGESLSFKKKEEEEAAQAKTASEIEAEADAKAMAEAENAAAAATDEAIRAANEEAEKAEKESSDDENTEVPEEVVEVVDPNGEGAASDPMSPHEEKQKTYMMQFIGQAMEGLGQDKRAMSNFDKFGVSLFLAGACETMSHKTEVY